MRFDWDENKANANIKNHDGVTFEEAAEIFFDEFVLEEFDEKHSAKDEKRFYCIGQTKEKILYVVFTVRDENTKDEVYRIISARFAEREEVEIYEQEKFKSGYFG